MRGKYYNTTTTARERGKRKGEKMGIFDRREIHKESAILMVQDLEIGIAWDSLPLEYWYGFRQSSQGNLKS